MVWEVFAIYHKDQPLGGAADQMRARSHNLDLWIGGPCVNDPKTDEYVKEQPDPVRPFTSRFPAALLQHCRQARPRAIRFGPMTFATRRTARASSLSILRKMYGTRKCGREWSVTEETRWDDEGLRNGSQWQPAT